MPDGVYWFSAALATLGLINVVWGGLCALAQKDLKKLVAYSSVNHMGYSLIGMAAVVAAGESNGLNMSRSLGLVEPFFKCLIMELYRLCYLFWWV